MSNETKKIKFEDLDLSFLYDLDINTVYDNNKKQNIQIVFDDKPQNLDIKNQKNLHVSPNRNLRKNKVRVGQILTIEDMVEIFGTKANKLAFQKKGTLSKNSKDALINKTKQHCSIVELNKDEHKGAGYKTLYEVKKVYDFTLNSKLIKYLNTEPKDDDEEVNIPKERKLLFKNILLKVVVNAILTNKNENNCLSFRLMEYARDFSLVNENYQYLKYTAGEKRQHMLNTLNVTELDVQDFYTSIDSSVNHAILDVLDVLDSVRAIACTKNMLILIKKNIDGTHYKKRATENEEGIITQAINRFVVENNIKDSNALYYNKQVKAKFNKYIKKYLNIFDAVSYYRTYEVFITNTALLKYILVATDFDKKDLPIYNLTLNTLFLDKMYINATNKKEQRIVKYACKSDSVLRYLYDNNIDFKTINSKNFKDIIPNDLIEDAIEDLKQCTQQKIKDKDLDRLSDTYVDLDHFDILCQTNIKNNPTIKLFCIDIDNSVENKQYNNTASVLN